MNDMGKTIITVMKLIKRKRRGKNQWRGERKEKGRKGEEREREEMKKGKRRERKRETKRERIGKGEGKKIGKNCPVLFCSIGQAVRPVSGGGGQFQGGGPS